MTQRFPRPRGDGPLRHSRTNARRRVSPPTRGWTHQPESVVTGRDGFPAHAGMDPHSGWQDPRDCRFPRPRGDGPTYMVAINPSMVVSPPTRGWTCATALDISRDCGFPAHAGMDPDTIVHSLRFNGFPRPRGDGPSATPIIPQIAGVSPPTRGWTLQQAGRGRGLAGFPAHAGMDLDWDWGTIARWGFPRPRGDGPSPGRSTCCRRQVSPPTRGWTPGGYRHDPAPRGFPAHAGMDPALASRSSGAMRFPRPRGDGPSAIAERGSRVRVSPPTRGWTPGGYRRDRRHGGFPAHAGMDPGTAGCR